MEKLLWSLLGLLLFLILLLLWKIYLLKKSAREITAAFSERLKTDTNTLIDISSRDKAMRELAAAINTQLRLLRRERQRFQQGDLELKETVTNISHDLRTPLTAICGYLDLLEREDTSENTRRYLAQIQNRCRVLTQLTEELFRYSVVTSSEKLTLEEVDMCRVLEESLLSFYAAMQQKSITPEIQLPAQPIRRMLDCHSLGRIFANIISNALKYSDGDFLVSMQDDGTIRFANTARGLSAVEVARLFDRYYTVASGHPSTGIGLAIAKHLTERMGGSITAEYQSTSEMLVLTLCFPSDDLSGQH